MALQSSVLEKRFWLTLATVSLAMAKVKCSTLWMLWNVEGFDIEKICLFALVLNRKFARFNTADYKPSLDVSFTPSEMYLDFGWSQSVCPLSGSIYDDDTQPHSFIDHPSEFSFRGKKKMMWTKHEIRLLSFGCAVGISAGIGFVPGDFLESQCFRFKALQRIFINRR